MTEVGTAVEGHEYMSRRTMKYGGTPLGRGQLFTLRGLVNDDTLVRLGYCMDPPPGFERKECRYCDAAFVDLNTLNAHGAAEHEQKPLMPPLSPQGGKESDVAYQNRVDEYQIEAGRRMDQRDEKPTRDDDRVNPLYLDNTAASKEVRPPAEG